MQCDGCGSDENRSRLLAMAQDFVRRVTDQSWVKCISEWAQTQATSRHIRVTGEPQLQRVRPWSALFTLDTTDGALWLKANCRAMAFEPMLHAELAQLAPGSIQAPLGVDADRGWMVTLDHGRTLADQNLDDPREWMDVVQHLIQLQQRCMSQRERLLATGLPDCAPDTVPARFDRLVVLLSNLPPEHPSRLGESDRQQLADARELIVQAAHALAAGPLGSSWQHGDAHLNNVYRVNGDLRVFDFGDSQWAHVLEALVVPYSILRGVQPDGWNHLKDMCADLWGISGSVFEEMWAAALRTQAVNRASTWHAVSEEIGTGEWPEWSAHAREHLMRSVNV